MVDFGFLNLFSYTYTYFGLFLFSLLTSIVVPIPTFPVLAATVFFLNPWIAALIFIIGSVIGEIIGYFTGVGTSKLLKRFKTNKFRKRRIISKIETLLKKRGFLVLTILAIVPLPMNSLGIAAGIVRYKKLKFALGLIIGRIFRIYVYTIIVLLGIRIFN